MMTNEMCAWALERYNESIFLKIAAAAEVGGLMCDRQPSIMRTYEAITHVMCLYIHKTSAIFMWDSLIKMNHEYWNI